VGAGAGQPFDYWVDVDLERQGATVGVAELRGDVGGGHAGVGVGDRGRVGGGAVRAGLVDLPGSLGVLWSSALQGVVSVGGTTLWPTSNPRGWAETDPQLDTGPILPTRGAWA
jgi:hypothetical protein